MRGVLTLAGEGTRMLPWSRGLRKEFLPLYDRGTNGSAVLKPIVHIVLETLIGAGITDVTMVVGAKDLATVQNYFTIDREFLDRHAHHADRLTETNRFYQTLANLRVRFAVQPIPRGFGDAVLQSEPFVGREPFLLHAADAIVLEPLRGRLPRRMIELREREDLDVVLLVRRVQDPTRYGVVEGRPARPVDGIRRLDVTGMEEKPAKPRSKWAATAVYAFSPRVFDALRRVALEKTPRELELTDAIALLLAEGAGVAALVMRPGDAEWRSVGSPQGYLAALQRTHLASARPAPAVPRRSAGTSARAGSARATSGAAASSA
jgi:UTP--glucose-1-phosphate uridylyltransferase